ncbi:MAG: cupin domain-containing protein [Oligoflexia bacterium]|nr:cupin domain-containing protein [Oligoflexia bacterium]
MSGANVPLAEVIKLEELVSHQSGAVISKTLIKKEKGNITLFAFAEGQGLSEHTAPFDAFVQILEGEAELIIGGKSLFPKAGETVVMPAGIPHAVKAPRPFKMLLTMIRG